MANLNQRPASNNERSPLLAISPSTSPARPSSLQPSSPSQHHPQLRQSSTSQTDAQNTSTRFLLPPLPHSSISKFILTHSHSPSHSLSSVALNENDLSVEPVGLDLDLQPNLNLATLKPSPALGHRFRRTRLLLLDIFKATILCLQTIHTANQFIGPSSSKSNVHQSSNSHYWYTRVLFPLDHPFQYKIYLLTSICVPGLHFILGCSTVLAIHTRRCLGWRSHSIFFRSLKLGISLLFLNQLLMSPKILQTRGKVILTTLPIWSLGCNLIFITTILVGLFLIERTVLNYLHAKTNYCSLEATHSTGVDEGEEELAEQTKWMITWADRIRQSIDIFLVMGAGLLPFSIGYMLPGNRQDPDSDWWIEWSQTRPWWFWFFFAPTPEMSTHPRFRMDSSFAPIGWLPFVLLGAFYGRRLICKPQERWGMFIRHLKLAIICGSVFIVITRILDLGNLSVPYERSILDPNLSEPVNPGLFRWLRRSWELALYTTSYPPDFAHLSLTSTFIFLIMAILDLAPVTLLSLSPLLQFGRSPIFFYSIQLLSFHYLFPSLLVILDWPKHLNLIWISIVSFCSLPMLWLACEAWVIFKDCQSPESIWRFF